MDDGLRDARRKMRTFERDQGQSSRQAERNAARQAKAEAKARAKAVNSARSTVGDGFNMALGATGLDDVTGIASDLGNFERNLTRFQILAGKTPEEMAGIRQEILAISRATGIASSEVLAGAQTYVDLTGDVGGATTAMNTFARVAQATGSSVQDVATAAAAMQDATKLDPRQFEAVFGALAAQGKAGAVNLRDMAGEMASLLPRFAKFKGALGADGVIQLGAAFQVARHGFGDASQAATGLEGLMNGLAKHADDFEAAGVRIYDTAKDGTKTFRNLHSIIVDIGKTGLAKDPTLLTKAFGRDEGRQAYDQLHRLAGMYDQMVEAGKNGMGTIGADFDTYINSPMGKMDASLNGLKVTIAETFTPERIKAFADAIAEAVKNIEPLVEGAGKIGSFLASFTYGVGKHISGALDDGEDADYKLGLERVVDSQGFTNEHGAAIGDDGHQAERLRKAKDDLAYFNSFSDARDSITGAEIDGKSSPASIQAALAAKYAPGNDAAAGGASDAGTRYLRAAGYHDPVEVAMRSMDAANAAIRQGLAKDIASAVRDALTNNLTLKIGSEPIQKGAANSIQHRRGQ